MVNAPCTSASKSSATPSSPARSCPGERPRRSVQAASGVAGEDLRPARRPAARAPAAIPSRSAAASGSPASWTRRRPALDAQQRRGPLGHPGGEARARQPRQQPAAASRTGWRRSSSAVSSNGSSASLRPVSSSSRNAARSSAVSSANVDASELARGGRVGCGAAGEQHARAVARPSAHRVGGVAGTVHDTPSAAFALGEPRPERAGRGRGRRLPLAACPRPSRAAPAPLRRRPQPAGLREREPLRRAGSRPRAAALAAARRAAAGRRGRASRAAGSTARAGPARRRPAGRPSTPPPTQSSPSSPRSRPRRAPAAAAARPAAGRCR